MEGALRSLWNLHFIRLSSQALQPSEHLWGPLCRLILYGSCRLILLGSRHKSCSPHHTFPPLVYTAPVLWLLAAISASLLPCFFHMVWLFYKWMNKFHCLSLASTSKGPNYSWYSWYFLNHTQSNWGYRFPVQCNLLGTKLNLCFRGSQWTCAL